MSGPGVIAVVIGRAGSRGLPGKNAMILGGRPMICHAIDAALAAEAVGRVIVSTDGDDIALAATTMSVPVLARPPHLADDEATVDAAVRHAIETLAAPEPVVVILYANVPVRPTGLIDDAVRRLVATGADSVQSYSPVGKHHPDWMVRLDDDGRVAPCRPRATHRRQELPALWLPDGGVIAVTRASLFTVDPADPHAFLGADRRGIVAPAGSVVDVDDHRDFLVAEACLAARREEVEA